MADVFIRNIYKNILLSSRRHYQKEKALIVYVWLIMSSYAHMIISRKSKIDLEDFMRCMKKFTAHKTIGAIIYIAFFVYANLIFNLTLGFFSGMHFFLITADS